jgi:tetratricopeptide (TPR) repeat protein
MGFIYLTKGRFQEAIEEYEKTTQLNPRSADLYNNLGVSYNRIGEVAKAKTSLQKALEVNPDYAPAHFNLAVIYCQEGEYTLAIQHSDRAAGLGYKNIPPPLLEKLKPYRKQ